MVPQCESDSLLLKAAQPKLQSNVQPAALSEGTVCLLSSFSKTAQSKLVLSMVAPDHMCSALCIKELKARQ